MLTIEEAIRNYEESERINMELAEISVSPLAKNHNLDNAEKCRQMIVWLRELQERRKAPEIVRCGECRYAINIGTPDMMCNNSKGWVVATDSNFGCILAERAERRTDETD